MTKEQLEKYNSLQKKIDYIDKILWGFKSIGPKNFRLIKVSTRSKMLLRWNFIIGNEHEDYEIDSHIQQRLIELLEADKEKFIQEQLEV